MAIRIIHTAEPLSDPAVRAVRDALRAGGLTAGGDRIDVPAIVRQIVRDVQEQGDQALIELTRRLDRATLSPDRIRLSPDEIQQAHRSADADFLALMARVADNIRRYQESILLRDPPELVRGGRRLGVRYTPIDRVGVYVPGGRALYPSTVLMTVVPAQVAGAGEIALVSPPTTDGDVNPMVLALAGMLGIDEVYRIGGAQAVAALAMGTPTVRAVEKIVGPGNAFVAEAKRQLFGRVGIDSVAGPSEVLIVADETAQPAHLAADLLAQAEHDPGSAVLVTPSADLARSVAEELERQLPALERSQAARAALDAYSAILVVSDLEAACDVANDFAAEHLQVIVRDEDAALARIRHAGAIFVGPWTPVPLGDYFAGPSHVLPTGGTARFFGPLSCNDFLKASSLLRYDQASLAEDAADVVDFATREGLTAHARAVAIRTQPGNPQSAIRNPQ
ncbi:MAG: Histidinol dehydrogenase [Planctomycetes bacterium ADurb.Bin126]|nr:MAG: Histidinol dehydrogenase [Planctomycetes bacterium ADurb.Bin126]HOD81306.1 histidinol dehydrogenase [Phycisphaerae bacterium]HQL74117.1 histidinol dehydrogenase [Phycisphaerae bacterium]